jgi:hypothetical protein
MAKDAPHPPPDTPPDTPADIEDLARRYVDLWQDQLAAMTADPEYWGAVQRLFDAFAAGASVPDAFAGGWKSAEPDAKAPGKYEESGESGEYEKSGEYRATGRSSQPSRSAAKPAETGAPAASPASRGGGDDMADIARRLARLEERLAALEAPSRSGRKRVAPRTRKPRT